MSSVDGESWSRRKVLRRTLWHERDHTEPIRKLIAIKKLSQCGVQTRLSTIPMVLRNHNQWYIGHFIQGWKFPHPSNGLGIQSWGFTGYIERTNRDIRGAHLKASPLDNKFWILIAPAKSATIFIIRQQDNLFPFLPSEQSQERDR